MSGAQTKKKKIGGSTEQRAPYEQREPPSANQRATLTRRECPPLGDEPVRRDGRRDSRAGGGGSLLDPLGDAEGAPGKRQRQHGHAHVLTPHAALGRRRRRRRTGLARRQPLGQGEELHVFDDTTEAANRSSNSARSADWLVGQRAWKFKLAEMHCRYHPQMPLTFNGAHLPNAAAPLFRSTLESLQRPGSAAMISLARIPMSHCIHDRRSARARRQPTERNIRSCR